MNLYALKHIFSRMCMYWNREEDCMSEYARFQWSVCELESQTQNTPQMKKRRSLTNGERQSTTSELKKQSSEGKLTVRKTGKVWEETKQ